MTARIPYSSVSSRCRKFVSFGGQHEHGRPLLAGSRESFAQSQAIEPRHLTIVIKNQAIDAEFLPSLQAIVRAEQRLTGALKLNSAARRM